MGRDVARVLGNIVHAHRLARAGSGAGDALTKRDVIRIHALIVADAEQVAQGLGIVIRKQDAEGVVVDQFAHGAGNFA